MCNGRRRSMLACVSKGRSRLPAWLGIPAQPGTAGYCVIIAGFVMNLTICGLVSTWPAICNSGSGIFLTFP
jgi:hypothetical protein